MADLGERLGDQPDALGGTGVSESEEGTYVVEVGLGGLEAAVPAPCEGAPAAVPGITIRGQWAAAAVRARWIVLVNTPRERPRQYPRRTSTVGLAHRLGHRPAQLSGGQQQRVACARALVGRPEIVFADEPTGNLDSRAAADILGFLRRCVRELGQTVVMVTHDPLAASHSDRIVFLSDGRIVDGLAHPTSDLVMSRMRQFDTSIGISHWAGPDAGP
ncbi:ABC transporter ATP-binding protein [Streptomyces sp. NPDC058316]|uniref:ABC transporter ATP-binding protein n=1 Tax=unclassified Streptomyces TaxID=2593676 RepID=UPI00333312A8